MIPKIIHYCWFGKNEINPTMSLCIESWRKICPEYEIRLWTEDNFDIYSHPFTAKMYKEKKWAFVADYARLKILYEYGGIYMDTDMFLLKNITPLLTQFKTSEVILAKESEEYINTAFFASSAKNFFLMKIIKIYDNLDPLAIPSTIPIITTNAYRNLLDSEKKHITVLDCIYFYPFTQKDIHSFNKHNAPAQSYGVHLYNFSWGSWYQKLLHKTLFYALVVKIITILGIKDKLKHFLKLS